MLTKSRVPVHFAHRNRLRRVDRSGRKHHRLDVRVCAGNAHAHRIGRLTEKEGEMRIGLLDGAPKGGYLGMKEYPHNHVDAGLI